MVEFKSHSTCQLCPLYESARSPGLPTRALYDGLPILWDRAILFVGQSPGHDEDKKGQSFVGYTGQLLEKLIAGSRLTDYCDIYLANAVRCKPSQGANETQSQIRKCRDYLIEDVQKLQAIYKEVIIVNLGAKACYSTLHLSSLNESLKKQAMRSPTLGAPGHQPRVFSTIHPARLHPTREPEKIRVVETHFSLLLRYLKGEFIPNELKVTPEILADVPKELPPFVAMDIETYGILSGIEQTVFHPLKSKVVDGVDFRHQIVTVSFAWEDGDKVRTALYMWKYKAHRQKIREWFRAISKQRVTLVNSHVKFDLMYLVMSGDKELPYWIDQRRLLVDDTLLMSFLLYEQQPEKGLKELSTLFGIADYSKSKVTGKSGTAKSCHDKNLHDYNCLDSAAALVLYEELKRRTSERYGKDSPKLGDVCAWMRNVIIWDTFYLEKHGSAFKADRLKWYYQALQKRCKKLLTSAEANHGIKLAGPGSDAPLRQLMLDCLAEADLLGDSRVEWTGKEKKISIGAENVNLAKEHLRTDSSYYDLIADFQEYKEKSKIVSTYTRPILDNPRKGIVEVRGRIGLVFPDWYPVPLYANRGGSSDDKSGGQIQGRFSCKKPARQTEPKRIRNCSISRWPKGKLIEVDMSSDHLRIAAMLSGDPILLETFNKNESLHLKTSQAIFPDIYCCDDFKRTHPKEYTLCKSLNFAVIFRCGPRTFQQTALHDVGLELDIEFCARAIKTWANKYHVYWKWQDKMIDLAAKQGYLILPTGWSRTFGLGQQNIAGQVSEVLNFLHQCPGAQLTHSAQYKIQHEFLKYRMRSLVCLNIYDSLFVDCYPGEEEAAKEILLYNMSNPPLLPIFTKWTGHKVKWEAELKEYH